MGSRNNNENSILSQIVVAKRKRIADERTVITMSAMVAAADDTSSISPAIRFDDVLRPPRDDTLSSNAPRTVSVIAEMKRSSPSAGVMDVQMDPELRAEAYCLGGVSAISVLTEYDYFRGSLSDLEKAAQVAHRFDVAVLEKDFVFDEYQVYQARASGADTVLLIIAILEPVQYRDLYAVATGLGMEPLVEVFDASELDVALTYAEPHIVGINNRNLKTLNTSLDLFPQLARRIPDDVIKVAESGMRSADDVRRMADAGAEAVLIGESLMKVDGDPSEFISQLVNIRI